MANVNFVNFPPSSKFNEQLKCLTWLLLLAILMLLAGCLRSSRTSRRFENGSVPSYEEYKLSSEEQKAADQTSKDPNCATKDCRSYRREFRFLVYVGKQIYCYWPEKLQETGTNFENLAVQLEQSITDQTSVTEYLKTLGLWASAFHDGHVNVMPQDLSRFEIYSAPVRLELFAPATDHEKVYVVQVQHAANVKVGDQVLAVNGVPVSAAIDAIEKRVSGSTRRMRRMGGARKLVDVLGVDQGIETLNLKLKKADSSIVDVSLFRNIDLPEKPKKAGANEEESSVVAKLVPSVRILPGGYGYIRIDGFSGGEEMMAHFDRALDRMMGTKGLIIDLRRNGGGDLSGDRILSRLARKDLVRYIRSERMNDFILKDRPENFFLPHIPGAPFSDWHELPVKLAPPEKRYTSPVVALISPYCFSACDTFAASLKDNGLATLIGEGTGGGTGTPLAFELPESNFFFRYSVVKGKTPAGNRIEGVGTLPDIVKEPVIADRINDLSDSQIDFALTYLRSRNGDATPISAGSLESVPAALATGSPTRLDFEYLQSIKDTDER